MSNTSPTPAQPLHTPIPWRASKHGVIHGGIFREYTNGRAQDQLVMVCKVAEGNFGTKDGNTQFIVIAVNAHAANEAKIAALVKALEPFGHPDLSQTLSGNIEGDASPIFGRDRAILKLGDFKRARAALAFART